MKRILLFASLALFIASCAQKESPQIVDELGVSSEIKALITDLGFNADEAFATDGGYIVEGDIFLSEEDLDMAHNPDTWLKVIVGNSEQYHTFNLVTGLPRNITVSLQGNFPSGFVTAVDNALARYNAENLQLTFSRVTSGGNIVIKLVNTGQYIASAGFPSSTGNPYPEVKYAKKYTNYSNGFMTTVIAHELGHCIGFRHTDYMNRAYSCGSGGNEGASTIGAVHIPGTPTGPDPNSWMLACLGATTDRPFNANDKVALNYLY